MSVAFAAVSLVFFFNDTATTEIYTLSLHDALPISKSWPLVQESHTPHSGWHDRSEEHTSELQSRLHLVCRLLLEKKKNASAAVTWHTGESFLCSRSITMVTY